MTATQKIKIDPDIEGFLAQAENIKSPEYMQARQDLAQEQNSQTHLEAFNSVVTFAEKYFGFLKAVKKVHPTQFRIGLDRATQAPSIVVVLPKQESGSVSDLMDTARTIELFIWQELTLNLNIWTLVDECLDEKRLERDYPYSRKTV